MKKGIAINNLILIILLVVDVNICCEAEGLIMAKSHNLEKNKIRYKPRNLITDFFLDKSRR